MIYKIQECDYCAEENLITRPSPFIADIGAMMCKCCWDSTQKEYAASNGEYIPNFEGGPGWEEISKSANDDSRIHELKIWPGYFDEVMSGRKKFEIRMNDRDFVEGDKIILKEWVPDTEEYTGNEIAARITCIVREFLPDDMVVFGFEPIICFADTTEQLEAAWHEELTRLEMAEKVEELLALNRDMVRYVEDYIDNLDNEQTSYNKDWTRTEIEKAKSILVKAKDVLK